MREQIQRAREIRDKIECLNRQLSEIQKPILNDTSRLPDIYNIVATHELARNSSVREMRLCFVLIAVYLYSPHSIVTNHPMRVGLRSTISKTIGRCRTEVSEIFAEAKFRYDRLDGFRTKVAAIIPEVMENISSK